MGLSRGGLTHGIYSGCLLIEYKAMLLTASQPVNYLGIARFTNKTSICSRVEAETESVSRPTVNIDVGLYPVRISAAVALQAWHSHVCLAFGI